MVFLKRYATLFLLIIVLLLAFLLRWYPMTLPFTDSWAQKFVDNSLQNKVTATIQKQYFNLPAQNQQLLVERELERIKQDDAKGYKQAIATTSERIKTEFQDEQGQPYLGDVDPYLYYLRTTRLVDHGYIGNTLVDGKSYDTYTLAPVGEFTDSNLHYYVVAYLYRILHAVNSSMTVKTVFAYVPILLSLLAIIPAFFLGRRIGGNTGALFAATLFAVHRVLVEATSGGTADTDPYTILFPLLILWLFVEGYYQKQRWKIASLMVLAGFFTGVFSFAWDGWWYIFDFIVVSIIGALLYIGIYTLVSKAKAQSLQDKQNAQQNPSLVLLLLILFAYLCSSITFITLFSPDGFEDVKTAPLNPFLIFTIKESVKASLWPNVYTSISELKAASIEQIGTAVGKLFLLLSLTGLSLFVMPKERKNYLFVLASFFWYVLLVYLFSKSLQPLVFAALMIVPITLGIVLSWIVPYEIDVRLAFILFPWYAGMLYASSQGVRFILLMIPPFIFCLTNFVGRFTPAAIKLLSRHLAVGKRVAKLCGFVIIVALLVNPIYGGYAQARTARLYPTNAWWDALGKVKNEAAQNAIITSWWDYGHWFKVMADRPVTFDGGNQNGPQAYWVGKFLLTWNETEALGILRMLDCASDHAYQRINKDFDDTLHSVTLVNRLVAGNKANARHLLAAEGFNQTAQDEILNLTHCIPPEAYVVTSDDMIEKAKAWSHFGGWDFSKAAMLQVKDKDEKTATQFIMHTLNISETDALQYYAQMQDLQTGEDAEWIAPSAYYDSTGFRLCELHNTTIACQFSQGKVIVDLKSMDASIAKSDGTVKRPESFAYASNTSFVVRQYKQDSVAGFGIGIVQEGNVTHSLNMKPQLTASMFTRLFAYLRYGTTYFTLFAHEKDFEQNDVLVWKVNWDKYLRDIGDDMGDVPKEISAATNTSST